MVTQRACLQGQCQCPPGSTALALWGHSEPLGPCLETHLAVTPELPGSLVLLPNQLPPPPAPWGWEWARTLQGNLGRPVWGSGPARPVPSPGCGCPPGLSFLCKGRRLGWTIHRAAGLPSMVPGRWTGDERCPPPPEPPGCYIGCSLCRGNLNGCLNSAPGARKRAAPSQPPFTSGRIHFRSLLRAQGAPCGATAPR